MEQIKAKEAKEMSADELFKSSILPGMASPIKKPRPGWSNSARIRSKKNKKVRS